MRKIGFIGALGLMCAVTGCAAEVPAERLQSSSAAIRGAEEVGAPRVPRAALHLQLAKEQAEEAKKLIANGDRDQAAMVLLRAEADANLAIALARVTNEQREAEVAAQKVRDLKATNK